MDVPLHKYWGACPPCPIGIDAPVELNKLTRMGITVRGLASQFGINVTEDVLRH